jgi:glycosyltransferase involved in cell wall biosynthesis/polysaccharide pyruvyl transferase WcaK-like protein
MPQILLAGAPTGCWTNLGDEAILAGMSAALRAARADLDLVVVSSSPPGFFEPYDCREVAYDDLAGIDRAVASSDLVVLGGGSIFFDYWGCDPGATLTPGHQGLSLWASVALLASAHERPLMVYGAGVGPLRTADGDLLAGATFEAAHEITLRDTDAAGALARLRLGDARARVTGDPALGIDLGDGPALELPRPWLGVALRQWDIDVDPDRWPGETAAALDRHLADHGGTAIFVPFHRAVSWPLSDDTVAATSVISLMERRDATHVVSVDLPWRERAALCTEVDRMLAMRYHAAVFAMAAGVPTAALSYDPKVAGFLTDWGVGQLTVPMHDLLAASISDRMSRIDRDESDMRATLTTTAERHRTAEHDNARAAMQLLDRSPPPRPIGRAGSDLVARLAASGADRPEPAASALSELVRRSGGRSGPQAVSRDDTNREPPVAAEGRVAILTNQVLDRESGQPCVGGAERYALELGRLLHDLGLAPTFFQLGGTGWDEGDLFGFPVVALPRGEAYSEFEYGLGQTFFDRTADFDRVLYLMPNYASGPMRDDAVIVSHGVWWDHDLWGHLSFRSPEWYEHLERVFARPAQVVSVDMNSINVVRALFPDAATRMTYVPSWVDTRHFHPPAERDDDPPRVLLPRRADVIRGPQLVGPILDQVPDPCRVTWLGGGDPALVDELRRVAARDPRFTVDTADFHEMPSRFRAADICVIPTVGSEGQSLACLEAMASGCAVVATRVGGLPELIRDGVDGLLCDPTADSLASALRRLVRDPQLRRRLGAEARGAAETRSLEIWRADWADVLVDLGWVESTTRATPYDIVCFSVIDWEFRWQRPQQMMTHWARRGRRVFYLRITDFLPPGDEPVTVSALAENVWEVRLALPDGFDLHAASHPDQVAVDGLASLTALVQEMGIDRAVAVVEHAGWTPLATSARAAFDWPLVYDCMDDWQTFPGFADTPAFLAAERDLVDRSDVMVVSSRTIQERWASRRPDLVLARNAVDFDFYQRSTPQLPRPADRPVAGFIGAIAEWFDRDLLLHVARARPDVRFVLVGGVHRVAVDELEALPNVTFVGQQAYDAMPEHLASFDVCLVPFEVTPVTDGMDVVKLYEYLSLGKPVVTTPIREILTYRDLVYVADGAEEFVVQLDRALAEDDPVVRDRRTALARQNTWDDRIDEVDRLILPHLGVSRAGPTDAASPAPASSSPGDGYWRDQASRLRTELDDVHRSKLWRVAGVYRRGLNRARRLAQRLGRGGRSGGRRTPT